MYVPGVLNKYCTDVPDVLIALVKTSTKETLELFNCVLLYIVLVPSCTAGICLQGGWYCHQSFQHTNETCNFIYIKCLNSALLLSSNVFKYVILDEEFNCIKSILKSNPFLY